MTGRKLTIITSGLLFISIIGGSVWYVFAYDQTPRYSDTEAGFEVIATEEDDEETIFEILEPETYIDDEGNQRYSRWGWYWREFTPEEEELYGNWERPVGPLKVGLQAGHWKNDEVPEELSGLTRNGGGAQGGGYSEVDTVLVIANRTKKLLEAEGIVVDVIPATIPIDYYADVFISIHADGNGNTEVSGFKLSGPRRDFSDKADDLLELLHDSYAYTTGLREDENVTRRMSSYYAFNWRRYDHALHPMTPAVILETGFMTSPRDRVVIVSDPDRAAEGITDGVLAFLRQYHDIPNESVGR